MGTAFATMAVQLLAAPSSLAADAVLDEVIVTAQRRAEDLHTVPISITVTDALTLQASGARDLSTIAAFAPNVSVDSIVTQAGSPATSSIYIRGMGQSDIPQTTDPGVGLFVDGVYVARAVGSLLDVADVERVEVLRGPQGTLFGRNTVGGAINVVTRGPREQFGLEARMTLGSYERRDFFGRIDAPLLGGFRSKVSFATFDQEGFVYRPNAGDRLAAGAAEQRTRNWCTSRARHSA